MDQKERVPATPRVPCGVRCASRNECAAIRVQWNDSDCVCCVLEQGGGDRDSQVDKLREVRAHMSRADMSGVGQGRGRRRG